MSSIADLAPLESNIFPIIMLVAVPLILILALMPKWKKFARAKKWIGNDIHKVTRPEVPESGGTILCIALVVGILLVRIFYIDFANEVWTILLTVSIAAIIGFVDDRKRLTPFLKIVSVLVAGMPVYIAHFFGFITLGKPVIPILGITQLTILYPLVTPILIAVSTNTVNMLEGYNGEGAGTCLIVGIAMLIGGIIQDSAVAVIFIIPFIAATAGFLKFNKFPAQVFPGDIGTLTMGAMIGGVMILGGIEVATFCALLAHVLNSFYVIISIRGLRESHSIKKKDIVVLEDNRIQASIEDGAPVTLPRLLLAYGELTEPQLVHHFWKLSLMAGCFGVIAAIATSWTYALEFDPTRLTSVVLTTYLLIIGACVIVFGLLYWKNTRLRGIGLIMVLLLLVGLGGLMVVDAYVVPLGNPWNLLVTGIIALPAFAVWYILQNRLFWRNIDRYKARFIEKPVKNP